MRAKYLKPLYRLHVQWKFNTAVWTTTVGLDNKSKSAALGKAVALALRDERTIFRAWISVYNNGGITRREAEWLFELYFTHVHDRIPCGLDIDRERPNQIVPLIGDVP